MIPPQDKLDPLDGAIAQLDQVLEAIRQIPCEGNEVVTLDGIAHELRGLAERLRSLRDDIATQDDRAE